METLFIATRQDAFVGFISFSRLPKVNNEGQEELEELCQCVIMVVSDAPQTQPLRHPSGQF